MRLSVPKELWSFVLTPDIDPIIFKHNNKQFDTYTAKCKQFYKLLIISKGKLPNMAWVALERILFVLQNLGSTLELFLMRPLRVNFEKICQWTKKIKDAGVYGWGRQIFPKSPNENKNLLKMSTPCLFKEIDAQLRF